MQPGHRTGVGRILASGIALVLVAVGGVACSGSEAPACEDGATTAASAGPVEMGEMYYRPDCIGASSGQTVDLTNVGEAPHTFTVEGTDVGSDVPAGEQGAVTLSDVEAGTYAVICTYHPQMKATLVVGEGSTDGGDGSPGGAVAPVAP